MDRPEEGLSGPQGLRLMSSGSPEVSAMGLWVCLKHTGLLAPQPTHHIPQAHQALSPVGMAPRSCSGRCLHGP